MLLSFVWNVEILWNLYQHGFIVELFPGKVLFLKLGRCCFECLNSCKNGGGNTSLQMKPMLDYFMLDLKTYTCIAGVFLHMAEC